MVTYLVHKIAQYRHVVVYSECTVCN